MGWLDFCLEKAEECDLRAADPTAAAAMAREWRLMAADWRVAASANDDDEDSAASVRD